MSLDRTTVSGNVTAGTQITGNGTISGTRTANSPSPALMAPPVTACSPYSNASGLGGKYTYSQATGDLTVSGQKTATLAPGTYCFHNLTVSGGSVLTVSGKVKIMLTGKLEAGGGSLTNATHVAIKLQIESSFAGSDGIDLSGGSGAYLTVYAPKTQIVLSGNSPVTGALLGKSISSTGGATIHYDPQTLGVWANYFEN